MYHFFIIRYYIIVCIFRYEASPYLGFSALFHQKLKYFPLLLCIYGRLSPCLMIRGQKCDAHSLAISIMFPALFYNTNYDIMKTNRYSNMERTIVGNLRAF